MLKKLLPFLLILLLVACAGAAEESYSTAAYDDAAYEEMEAMEDSGGFDSADYDTNNLSINRETTAQQTQRLVIKTGNMSVEVDDIDIAVGNAVSYVTGLGGYAQSQNVSGSGRYKSASLTLSVPVVEFENAMATFREYGEVNSESASGEDVTEEFVDLNSRLTNLEATQTRLRELYAAAKDVDETLEVDRELRRIEEEINVVQGRINYLSERASFSTINLSFSFIADPEVPEPEAWNLSYTISNALSELQTTAQNVVEGFVYFGIVCGPWLLVLALLAWPVMAIVRRIRRRRQES